MTEDARKAVAEWASLLNAGDYFEAHEVVETAWMKAAEPDKTFLKGLIHAAVSLCHYQRRNGHGARVKYASCLRYLDAYRPRYAGVEVEDLTAQMDRFFAPLISQPPGTVPPPPEVPWPKVRLARGPETVDTNRKTNHNPDLEGGSCGVGVSRDTAGEGLAIPCLPFADTKKRPPRPE